MTSPVSCTTCNGIYDLGAVTVTARYTDCSVFVAPCCGRTVADGFGSSASYTVLRKRPSRSGAKS